MPFRCLPVLPRHVVGMATRIASSGLRVWIVGGAVRDALLNRDPVDWDLYTDCREEELIGLLPSDWKVIPVGRNHGVLQVIGPGGKVEITFNHGESTSGLPADLARRDFTINAMAVSFPDGTLVDPHDGRRDLRLKRIRGVSDPRSRFMDDPLRVLRAARFVSTLGFRMDERTYRALKDVAPRLGTAAPERIRDEMLKIICAPRVFNGFEILRKSRTLKMVLPELLEGWRKSQNHYHRFDIYRHTLCTVEGVPPETRVRLAALFHDIAKPRVRKRIKGVFRFYGHAEESAIIAESVMNRWKMSKSAIEDVSVLIRNHMAVDTDRWRDGTVRRFVLRVGRERLEDLFALIQADRLSHDDPLSSLQALERFRSRVQRLMESETEAVLHRVAVDGRDVMRIFGLSPGPEVGRILRCVREWILDDPTLNQRERLLARLHRMAQEQDRRCE